MRDENVGVFVGILDVFDLSVVSRGSVVGLVEVSCWLFWEFMFSQQKIWTFFGHFECYWNLEHQVLFGFPPSAPFASRE